MDMLLSLPIASYLFSTSLTSWSTSLNLLFFYMTWSTLVLSHSPLKIEIVSVTALRIAFWLVPSLLFLAFDTLLPSLSESIKYNGASALLPRDAKTLTRLAGLALSNLALETALEAAISLGLTTILTYYTHTSSHNTPASRSISLPIPKSKSKSTSLSTPTPPARLHAQYAHSPPRTRPPLRLKADHPVPYLLHRFLPLYLPALALSLYHHYPAITTTTTTTKNNPLNIFTAAINTTNDNNLHILTYLVFVALATLEETLAMSGYTVVPGILLGGVARRTAIHYSTTTTTTTTTSGETKSRCSGNFGSWGVLDWVHGTSVGGDVMGDLRDEAEKHRLQERGARKVGEVGGAVRDGVEGLRAGNGAGRRGRRGKGRGGDGRE
ncbi:hypothetical protein NEMBOFW57_006731 [Staphylotrichum longicolle]|uniref:Fatty acid hydroxylase domain-containing protein n=1 Tax=Staphylotrichum longicolle TaxID=669026 RepID=A0AAD4EU51_9PEZI|nr:hypothetical protein NEMBOFW57_006731 [Staphylotrichum longicolle]